MSSQLQIENIGYKIGLKTIISNLSLNVDLGEILSVTGSSGSGKSSLLRLISGLYKLKTGRIVKNGVEISGPRTHVDPADRKIGLSFQDNALFPHLTVKKNICFGTKANASDARIVELVELLGLTGLKDRYPHELSGGQQQRVGLARTLAAQPDILLLDEPFSSLDKGIKRPLIQKLRNYFLAHRTTVIMVSHDVEESLSLADRLVIIEGGQIVADQKPEAIYHYPSSSSVAEYFGKFNALPIKKVSSLDADPENCLIETDLGVFEARLEPHAQSPQTLGIRPSGLVITPLENFMPSGKRLSIKGEVIGKIIDIRFAIPQTQLIFETDTMPSFQLVGELKHCFPTCNQANMRGADLKIGQLCSIRFDPTQVFMI